MPCTVADPEVCAGARLHLDDLATSSSTTYRLSHGASVDLPPVPVESVMAETAPLSRTTTLGSDGQRDDAERLAACFNCKRSKLKCVRAGGSATCTRCRQRRIECTAPAYHVGRHKGVKK